MPDGDSYSYTENLSQIRERLARLEERIEDIAGMKSDVGTISTKMSELCELEAGYRSRADSERSTNKWLSRTNLAAWLALAGKAIYDAIGM